MKRVGREEGSGLSYAHFIPPRITAHRSSVIEALHLGQAHQSLVLLRGSESSLSGKQCGAMVLGCALGKVLGLKPDSV